MTLDQIMFKEINKALIEGSRIAHIFVSIDKLLDEARRHKDNRDEDKNIKANPHHQKAEFALSKMCFQIGYSEESKDFLVTSGNCRLKSLKKALKEGYLSKEFLEQLVSINIMYYDTDFERKQDLQFNGGKGVSWSPSEIEKAIKGLSSFVDECGIFVNLSTSAMFDKDERKDLSRVYLDRCEELTLIFKTIQDEIDNGIDLKIKRRSANTPMTVLNVSTVQVGILKGIYDYLKDRGESADTAKVAEFIKQLVQRRETEMTTEIFTMLVEQAEKKLYGSSRTTSQAGLVQYGILNKV